MAKTVVTQYTDDLDGSKAQGTVQFAFAGTAYEIDLSAKNAKAFEKAISPYIDAARRIRSKSARGSRRASRNGTGSARTNLSEVRAWAQGNGYTVAERGRIPGAVIEAYNSAN